MKTIGKYVGIYIQFELKIILVLLMDHRSILIHKRPKAGVETSTKIFSRKKNKLCILFFVH